MEIIEPVEITLDLEVFGLQVVFVELGFCWLVGGADEGN